MPVAQRREVVRLPHSWCRPRAQVQAPVRSLDQRMEALKRANDIRVKRAQLKKDLKSGEVSIDEILARSARVRLDREGLRHAHGGAQVRSREGRPAAHPVPDQPVEDDRRSVRPSAARADWPLQPLAAAVFVVTGPSGAGKGTMVQALARARPRAAAVGLGDDAAAAARRGRRRALLVPLRRGVRPPRSPPATSSSTSSSRGASARGRCSPSSTASATRGTCRCSSSSSKARSR